MSGRRHDRRIWPAQTQQLYLVTESNAACKSRPFCGVISIVSPLADWKVRDRRTNQWRCVSVLSVNSISLWGGWDAKKMQLVLFLAAEMLLFYRPWTSANMPFWKPWNTSLSGHEHSWRESYSLIFNTIAFLNSKWSAGIFYSLQNTK